MTIHVGNLSGLPGRVRTVVFVGTRTSDHLLELMRIAEFKGKLAYRIQDAVDLQPRWFVGVEDVGVVPGADHLEPVLKAVVERLHRFADVASQGMLEGVAA
jgi:4-hydroxy-3-methylbut-2-enyl diphosphate reductase IspH